ncbi:MAG: hypothetical protein ABI205_12410 [Gemmatimonadaceae bacterium]
MGGGFFVTAAAQRDTVQRAVPPDTASSTVIQPTSIAGAEAAGVKLLGVFDASTGDWIDRATVRDTLGNQTQTSKIGVAALNVLSPVVGYYMFEVRKEGYASQRYRLRADTAAEFLVSLTPNPLGHATALPAMLTTDRREMLDRDPGLRAGFFVRCEAAVVHCVGPKDLERRPTDRLGDLLTNLQGVHRTCTTVRMPAFNPPPQKAVSNCIIQMKPIAGPPLFCTPTYFLNGVRWDALGGSSQAQLDQFLNASIIDGIEVYLSDAPIPGRFYVPQTECGAVVIWSR